MTPEEVKAAMDLQTPAKNPQWENGRLAGLLEALEIARDFTGQGQIISDLIRRRIGQ